jgi:putative oxidoreductase
MSKIINCLKGKCVCTSCGLLILRCIPAYYLIANHGWGKITDPSKWNWLGSTLTKYFFGILDFANPFFGFLAAFSESICAVLVFIGLLTRPAALLVSGTMFVAAFHHITTTGSPESAWMYFAIFMTLVCLGPGKYSIDNYLFSKNDGE